MHRGGAPKKKKSSISKKYLLKYAIAILNILTILSRFMLELELELIQSHMTQKPVLRGEVDARALRV